MQPQQSQQHRSWGCSCCVFLLNFFDDRHARYGVYDFFSRLFFLILLWYDILTSWAFPSVSESQHSWTSSCLLPPCVPLPPLIFLLFSFPFVPMSLSVFSLFHFFCFFLSFFVSCYMWMSPFCYCWCCFFFFIFLMNPLSAAAFACLLLLSSF